MSKYNSYCFDIIDFHVNTFQLSILNIWARKVALGMMKTFP